MSRRESAAAAGWAVSRARRLDAGESPRFRIADRGVVYAGDDSQERSKGRLVAWADLVGEPWSA